MKRAVFIGTSGWMYKDWGERFYPKNIRENFLKYFSKEFKTVEINSSFYRMPSRHTFSLWRSVTPSDFKFAVKLNQFITHRKRLILDSEESRPYLRAFLLNCQKLEKKFAALLIQLPPSFKMNMPRLEIFLGEYSKMTAKLKFKPLTAIEFRNDSWFNEEIYKILNQYKIALVIASRPEIRNFIFTAPFTYIRMHGSENGDVLYLKKDLVNLKTEIDNFPQKIKRIFIYFNNDYSAYAVDNARYLISLFRKK